MNKQMEKRRNMKNETKRNKTNNYKGGKHEADSF